tara:strand:- start:4450 stop:4878 length:429 start_codon:yes stop_codon:yes gene_type:complete
MKIISSIFILLILISSCKTAKENSSEKKISEVFKGSYNISMLNGENILSKELTFSVDFSSNKISGSSGCNTYFADFELSENNHIYFNNIATTKLYCASKDKNEIERKFISVLANTFDIVLKENEIELKGVKDNSQKIILVKS